MKISLQTENETFYGELNDSLTAREIAAHLPLTASVSRWGDEIYFDLGFKASAEEATMEVTAGTLAYWPQGKAFCIFFGPTPASTSEYPLPASPVVIVGQTSADPQRLRTVQMGENITLLKIVDSGPAREKER